MPSKVCKSQYLLTGLKYFLKQSSLGEFWFVAVDINKALTKILWSNWQPVTTGKQFQIVFIFSLQFLSKSGKFRTLQILITSVAKKKICSVEKKILQNCMLIKANLKYSLANFSYDQLYGQKSQGTSIFPMGS